ncbi:hypothetical protein [Nocardioides sp.]|uniref:hypothetical protein n=1 Tax=Nocardioides sp. TaxID=35761 RepID=UPI002B267629|nr:hypothetical protein [Nocardioides sp.]
MSPTAPTSKSTPASVYWRRRFFTVGVVLALVLIAVNVVRGGPDPVAGVRASTASAPTLDESTAVGPSSDAAATTGKKKGKRKRKNAAAALEPSIVLPAAPVLVEPDGECAEDDVLVTPEVKDAVAGQSVTIVLKLRTLTQAACTWAVSADTLAVKVSVGTDEVWASRHCPDQVPERTVVVRQAVTSTYQMRWNTRRSDEDCPGLTEYAAPGEYRVSAAPLGGDGDFVIFDLALPPTPTPTPAPEPEPEPEKKKKGAKNKQPDRG